IALDRSAGNQLHLGVEFSERHHASFAFCSSKRQPLAKNVDRENLFFSLRRRQNFSFLWKALSALHVKLVLVAKAAHEASTRSRDLRGVERQPLVLRDAEVYWPELRQP